MEDSEIVQEMETEDNQQEPGMNDDNEPGSLMAPRIVHGTQQHASLLEKIARERIYESVYWKEHLFNVNAATICDRAVELTSIGGLFGNQQPAPFLCLLLKLLHLRPDLEIVLEYLRQEDFKYLRALGAVYWRLVAHTAPLVYQHLEPLLCDYRKLRKRLSDGTYVLTYMDELVEELLTEDRVCDTTLPRLVKRDVLEDLGELEPRESPLADLVLSDEDDEGESGEEESLKESVKESVKHEIELERTSSPELPTRLDGRLKLKSKSRKKHDDLDEDDERDNDRHDRRRQSREDRPRRHSRSRSRHRRSRSRSRRRDSRLSRSREDRQSDRRRENDRNRSDRRSRDNNRDSRRSRSREDPRNRRHHEDKNQDRPSGQNDASLSVEETNRLRISLGLKPLQ